MIESEETQLSLGLPGVSARVLEGGADSEILKWCYAHGHRLDENDKIIWNGFISELGWDDAASDYLAECKAEAGVAEVQMANSASLPWSELLRILRGLAWTDLPLPPGARTLGRRRCGACDRSLGVVSARRVD